MAGMGNRVGGGSALILIVEGHRDTRDMYAQWFEYVGYRVVCTDTADEGLKNARELRPDVIATELALQCADGRELCEALKTDARTRHIPIVVVTAWATPEHLGRARHLGCDAVMIKPVLPGAVQAEVARILTTVHDKH